MAEGFTGGVGAGFPEAGTASDVAVAGGVAGVAVTGAANEVAVTGVAADVLVLLGCVRWPVAPSRWGVLDGGTATGSNGGGSVGRRT